jgi:hypothetical protein
MRLPRVAGHGADDGEGGDAQAEPGKGDRFDDHLHFDDRGAVAGGDLVGIDCWRRVMKQCR